MPAEVHCGAGGDGDSGADGDDGGHYEASGQVEAVSDDSGDADVSSGVFVAAARGEKRGMGGLEAGDDASGQAGASAAQSTGESRLIVVLRVLGVALALLPGLVTLVKPILPASVGDALYWIFSPVCHNRPSRTMEWFGTLMPLCSRCYGVFLGFGTAGFFPKPKLSIGTSLLYGFVASVIMVADVITQDMGLHPVWHGTRITTGVIWGHVCGLGVLAVVRKVFK